MVIGGDATIEVTEGERTTVHRLKGDPWCPIQSAMVDHNGEISFHREHRELEPVYIWFALAFEFTQEQWAAWLKSITTAPRRTTT